MITELYSNKVRKNGIVHNTISLTTEHVLHDHATFINYKVSYKILGSRVLDIKSSGHPLSIIPLSALDNNLNYKMTNLLLSLRSKVRGLL